MLNDILVILMATFGLFAIGMFILYYVYLKKHYNNKRINNDDKKNTNSLEDSEDFIPRKKK